MTEVFSDLHSRYGSSKRIAAALINKLDSFKNEVKSLDQGQQLQQLTDLCKSVCYHQRFCHDLNELDYSAGLFRVRSLLLIRLQNMWAEVGQE